MPVFIDSGYSGTYGSTHARIAHAGNWITGGTASATATATGFFVDGPETSLTYEKWRSSSASATWTYSFGGTRSIDYVAIAAHTFGTDSATCQVQVQISGVWTTVKASGAADTEGATSIATDEAIFVMFSTVSATGFRIVHTGGPVSIGVAKAGLALQMERPMYGGHTPQQLAPKPELRTNTSTTGEFLGRTQIRSMRQTEYNWSNLTAAWIRDNWPSFQSSIATEPFFIAWRPSSFSDCGFGYVEQIPAPSNQGVRDLMQVGLSFVGYDV